MGEKEDDNELLVTSFASFGRRLMLASYSVSCLDAGNILPGCLKYAMAPFVSREDSFVLRRRK